MTNQPTGDAEASTATACAEKNRSGRYPSLRAVQNINLPLVCNLLSVRLPRLDESFASHSACLPGAVRLRPRPHLWTIGTRTLPRISERSGDRLREPPDRSVLSLHPWSRRPLQR